MADLQKTAAGYNIVYPGTANSGNAVLDSTTPGTKLYIFLNGGTVDGKTFPKVDMSLWDQATMCGTCHVGGSTYEHDRNNVRLPLKAKNDMASGEVNPFTSTVWESYTANGTDTSFAAIAPWTYPMYDKNGPVMAPFGWGDPTKMKMTDHAGDAVTIAAGQLMMPNVKEMDCLFCHLQGYDNVPTSVMVQAGNLLMAPSAGAGLFDMTPISQTYMGYNPNTGNVAFTPAGPGYGEMATMEMVAFTPSMISRIKGKPEANNCMQCHATKTLKDLPEMFGVTGTSSGFLSSAPMIYDPANSNGAPLGKRMTAFDINAMWLPDTMKSPVIDGYNAMTHLMPGLAWPQAMGATPFTTGVSSMYIGGGNTGKTGPLYYYNDSATPDQNVLKRSTAVFARAEWFKRGDAWQEGQDVHTSFGCAGCHFTDNSTDKNQCDPGRGFDMSSTTQDGVPPLSQRQVVKGYDETTGAAITTTVAAEQGAAIKKHDTRNTVKRCEFCHVTGKDYNGAPINTYGAPNPTRAHSQYGLSSDIVQIVDKIDTHNSVNGGGFGGQGVSEHTNFTTANTKLGRGNHLDVMDCTVCHVQKVSMAVRALDATSGMRYPAVVGTDPKQGMIGLFEDPAPDTANAAARDQYNGMYQEINRYFGYTLGTEPIGAPCAVGSDAYTDNGSNQVPGPGYQNDIPLGAQIMGSPLKEWKPLHLWQKLGNMEAPLSFGTGAVSQLEFRRKIYLSNAISAILWNNTDSTVDANGDSVNGGLLVPSKASLAGYTDVFDNDPINENNTQGFGEPIYDPWIAHDLKAGFNFGPSALSVISVGFGGFGTPDGVTDPTAGAYQTAYNADGTFTGAWKYASVWSGAVTFTEPSEITAYKNYRNAIEPTRNGIKKNWDKTELAYIGAPFMVTHGVKGVSTYVKGKTCADCHAPDAEFFNGGFNMTGTAIPASATYNPTAEVNVDAKGNLVLDANGDPINKYDQPGRNPGIPTLNGPSDLMHRPLEPIRVKAKIGDLRTAFEGFNKLGQPRTTLFQESNATHTWTTDIKRSNVLYPEDDHAIYYRIADTNEDGTIKANAVAMTGQQYADYMETLGAAVTIPTASIESVNSVAATGGTTMITVDKGQSVDLVAASVDPKLTYTWSVDGVALAAGSTSATFPKTGIKRLTLTVTNALGQKVATTQRINVVAPVLIAGDTAVSSTTASVVIPLQTITVPHTKVKISWGDSSYPTTVATTGNLEAQTHTYKLLERYQVGSDFKFNTIIQLFNGTTLVSSKSVKITVTP